MRIRVENLTAERFVLIVLANKSQDFLISKELVGNRTQMSYITDEDGQSIITVIKLKPHCPEFARVDSVTVGGNLLYGYSNWTARADDVVIEKK